MLMTIPDDNGPTDSTDKINETFAIIINVIDTIFERLLANRLSYDALIVHTARDTTVLIQPCLLCSETRIHILKLKVNF